ncbi:uncharacterized protein EAF01_005786 [Botrytis porri]|uniref:uncharacterized protein n=1 Tax=Botrytis porri TaxID=87229 RepID=UPI00190157BC|nr:uncharacterized protein EAF01_005786 [Botrytis porri]KAF7905265.1 hypothetical protein EAF01_005786 [Botrytis porri]
MSVANKRLLHKILYFIDRPSHRRNITASLLPKIEGYPRSSRSISTSQKSSFLQPEKLFFISMRKLRAYSSELNMIITFDLARPNQRLSAEN